MNGPTSLPLIVELADDGAVGADAVGEGLVVLADDTEVDRLTVVPPDRTRIAVGQERRSGNDAVGADGVGVTESAAQRIAEVGDRGPTTRSSHPGRGPGGADEYRASQRGGQQGGAILANQT